LKGYDLCCFSFEDPADAQPKAAKSARVKSPPVSLL